MAKRILLADDSITIQKVVELTFSDGDYEVTAVNNGNKAVQKLSEMRPDIILSDIIMPEKNGYEVCEYVKSHPEFRNIPVILLTGTFEPFDPDRADKAGCDAVVTKPFESQSLISKVEELIAAAQSAPAATPAAEPVPEPESFAADTSPWAEETTPVEAPPPAFQTHDADIFSAPPASEPEPTMETPFDSGAFGGETRAFPRMSFEELQQMAAAPPEPEPPPPPPAPEPSPWDEPAPVTGGETRAFPRMSFEELQAMAASAPAEEASPWSEPSASPFEAEAEPLEQQEAPFEPEITAPQAAFEEPESFPTAVNPQITDDVAPTPPGDLTDDQIDRIARRVVQLMSEQVVRNIAWEVIPDLAEMVVKERIRQLEAQD